jgi:hypothetical protein
MNVLCLRVVGGELGKDITEEGDKRGYFLLRRGRMIACILFVGMLPLQNVGILITEA